MSEKVKLSKDGSSIDFVQSDNIPTSMKKFRQSPEIEGFYRFIFENDLQKEAYEILDRIIIERKAKKSAEKAANKAKEKEAAKAAKGHDQKHVDTKAKPPALKAPAPKGKTVTKAAAVHTEVKAVAKPTASAKSAPKGKASAKPVLKKAKK
jgi:hypothetical protein